MKVYENVKAKKSKLIQMRIRTDEEAHKFYEEIVVYGTAHRTKIQQIATKYRLKFSLMRFAAAMKPQELCLSNGEIVHVNRNHRVSSVLISSSNNKIFR